MATITIRSVSSCVCVCACLPYCLCLCTHRYTRHLETCRQSNQLTLRALGWIIYPRLSFHPVCLVFTEACNTFPPEATHTHTFLASSPILPSVASFLFDRRRRNRLRNGGKTGSPSQHGGRDGSTEDAAGHLGGARAGAYPGQDGAGPPARGTQQGQVPARPRFRSVKHKVMASSPPHPLVSLLLFPPGEVLIKQT